MPSFVTAQVIIKEKVEINPLGNILPEYPQSIFDPCLNIHRPDRYQSVYSCIGYPIEPIQQLFPWQAYPSSPTDMTLDSASIYQISIISGSEYAYFFKATYWDTVLQVPVEPEYLGSEIVGLTGSEIAGWGGLFPFVGTGLWEREHQSDYQIVYNNHSSHEVNVVFTITNLSTGYSTDWHTAVVNPQLRYKDFNFDGDTISHYIGPLAKTGLLIPYFLENLLDETCQFQTGCPPEDIRFNMEIIDGQQYGKIIKCDGYYETCEYSTAFYDLTYDDIVYYDFYYTPDGEQPDSTGSVTLRISSTDSDIGLKDYAFYVKRNFFPPVSEDGSIVLQTSKETAVSGDTLDVNLLWDNGIDGITEFPEGQEFSVWLAEGFNYGTILNPETGDTSDTFTEIGKQFKLVINKNITKASAKITLAATADVFMLGGPMGMQKNNIITAAQKKANKLKTFQKQNISDKNEEEIITTDFIISSKFYSGIKEIIVNPFIIEIDPPRVSAGDTARIIPKYMDENGDYVEFDSLQTFELGMLDGCILGKLSSAGIDTNYFYGVTQPFYFIADSSADSGTVSIRVSVIEMNPQNRSLTNNNPIENDNPVSCANISFVENLYANKSLVLGDLIEINYVKGDKFITEFPKMPEILFTARPKFQLIGPYDLVWELEVKWIDKRDSPDRITKEIFRGDETGFGNTAVLWSVPWDAKIIGGDKIKITASIVYGGYLYTASKNLDIRVIGENTTPAEIKSGLSLFEQIIVYKESWPKWKHFNESGSLNGFPIWGWPHGYGLMQIDNPRASDEEIWNWKKNVDAGKRLIQDKKSIFADPRYEKVIKKYTAANYYSDNELMMQLWQLYNGGFYYKWKPDFPKKKNSTGKWVKDNPPIVKGHEKPYAEEAWEIYDGIINGNYPIDWGN
ncbi:MAG: hypothetical protein KBE38_12430 [Ignavibacterium sp.]|nr:hypothetical protein [Ignavibacterium sp.]